MKVLIVGLGSIAKKHIKALKEIDPDVEIEALRSSKSSNTVEGIKNIFTIPENVNYDFIIISNPTAFHANEIERFARYKIPLFIEKPVFESVKYDELVNLVISQNIKTYVACNLRFLGCLNFLHEYFKNNQRRINEINVYCGSYLPEWRPNTDYRLSYSANASMGGGVNLDLIHEIDYICWLFGKPLYSKGICSNRSSLKINAVDYANYILLYEKFPVSIVLNYYRRDYKRQMEILFDDETWVVDLKENSIKKASGEMIYSGGLENSYLKQMKYFIQTLDKNQTFENNIEFAYETLKITLKYEGFKK